MSDIKLVKFLAGDVIEFDNPMTGAPIVAMVTDSGTECIYVDGDDLSVTAMPIFSSFNPIEIEGYSDRALSFILNGDREGHEKFSNLLIQMADNGYGSDPLNLNRAAKYAQNSGDLNFENVINHVKAENKIARDFYALVKKNADAYISAGVV